MDDMLSTNEEQSFGWRSICHPTSILQVGHLLETDSLHFPSHTLKSNVFCGNVGLLENQTL